MGFTDQFTGHTISPVTSRYQAITLDEDIELVWPIETAVETNLLVEWLDVTPDTAGWDLTFPDATEGATGFATIITNLGSDSYTVKDNAGGTIQVIDDGEAWLIWLKTNSTAAGTWGVLQIGSTTSEASASVLAGNGLTVIGLTLNQSHPVWALSGNYTIIPGDDRARLLKWTGGSGTVSVPSASVLGDNWFTLFSNQGSASVIIDPSGAQTIDGAATKSFSIGESAFIISDGSNLFTVGYGRSTSFVETYSNIDVSGSANVTLTSSQFAASGINLFGTLTGNIDVIVPAAVHSFIVFNNTTGSFTLTVKVSGMTGVSVTQGKSSVLFCNGTDVVAGNTSSAVSTVLFDNGTVTAPSITFTSDTDTGLFRFAANTIGIAAGGVLSGRFNTVASGVNAVAFTPGATGTAAILGTYSGTDTNVGLTITPQGTGVITLNGPAVAASTFTFSGNLVVGSSTFTVTAASGNTVITGTLGVTGNVAVNTNKFNITAASGNTTIAGTLGVTGAATLSSTLDVTGNVAVNTNKFNITAASGNTTIAGTLGVTGTSTIAALSATTGTFSSTLAATGNFAINTNKFNVTASSGNTTVAGTLGVTGDVTSSGTITGTLMSSTSDTRTDATGSFYWGTRSVIRSPSDGVITLLNNAETAFTRLQFGGTTSSFPSLRRTTTALNIRLADDSADAALTAAAITGTIITGSNFVVTASTAPANGINLVAANTLGLYSNSAEQWRINTTGTFIDNGSNSDPNPGASTTAGIWLVKSTHAIAASRSANPCLSLQRSTSDGDVVNFYRDTTAVGSISVTATATAYNTSSDVRLKKNIIDLDIEESSDVIDVLRPVAFTWKKTDDADVGFIAQEVYKVVPSAITKGDHEDDYWQMDASKLIPYMVAEIKSLRARVAILES